MSKINSTRIAGFSKYNFVTPNYPISKSLNIRFSKIIWRPMAKERNVKQVLLSNIQISSHSIPWKKKKSTQKKLDTCKKKEVKLGIYSLPNSGNTVMNYKPLDNAMIINDKK